MEVQSMLIGGLTNLVTLGLWLLVAYSVVFYYRWFMRTPKYPGPFPFPVIGNLLLFLRESNGGDLAEFSMRMKHRYGDRCEFWLLGDRYVLYSHADDVARMFTANSGNKYLTRTPPREGLNEVGFGNRGIVFNRDLESWRLYRKFFSRALSTLRLTSVAVTLTRDLFKELEGYWKELGSEPVVEFDKWSHRISADIITIIATGKCDGAMKRYAHGQDSKNQEDLVSKVEGLFSVIGYFIVVPNFLRNYVLWPITHSLLQRRIDMIEHANEIINETHSNLEHIPKNFITEQLLYTKEDEAQSMSVEDLSQNVAEMLGGGTDTTSNTLCLIVYYLIKNPHVERRLAAELEEVFGDSNRDIAESDLASLPYTKAVINEVMRMKSVTPILWKTPTVDDTIDGQLLKTNTQTLVHIQGIHLNPAHWKNPENFDPDRFIKEKVPEGAFLPFGGGQRICPGRILALVELQVLVASLYRKYTFELVDPNVRLRFTIVTHCDGLRVRVVPRKKIL